MTKKYPKRTNYAFKLFIHRLKIIGFFVFIFLFLSLSYWFIFLSNFFQIKQIKSDQEINIFPNIEKDIREFLINKNKKFVPQAIYKFVPQYSKNTYNMLLLSQKELISYLKTKYPDIEDINFKLNLKENILMVSFKMREIKFLICDSKGCFFTDKNGIIFAQAPQVTGSLIDMIYLKNNNLKLGEKVFDQNEIKMFDNIFAINKREDYVFRVKSIEMDSPSSTDITINTTNGWQLLISFNSNLEIVNKIISGLFNDLLNKVKNRQENIIYIDVRDYPQVRYLLR